MTTCFLSLHRWKQWVISTWQWAAYQSRAHTTPSQSATSRLICWRSLDRSKWMMNQFRCEKIFRNVFWPYIKILHDKSQNCQILKAFVCMYCTPAKLHWAHTKWVLYKAYYIFYLYFRKYLLNVRVTPLTLHTFWKECSCMENIAVMVRGGETLLLAPLNEFRESQYCLCFGFKKGADSAAALLVWLGGSALSWDSCALPPPGEAHHGGSTWLSAALPTVLTVDSAATRTAVHRESGKLEKNWKICKNN